MKDINERTYIGDIVRTEESNGMSRKRVTILSSAALLAGTVLGEITLGAATVEEDEGNTGDGVVGAVTLGPLAEVGDYVLTGIAEAGDAGTFSVFAPDGKRLPDLTVAVAYVSDHINLTIADGAADWDIGDIITVTVPAGSGKYKMAPATAVDGSNTGAAILLEDADASAGDVTDVLVLYRDAQADITRLIYDDTVDDAEKQAAVRAGLVANNIQFLSAA